MSLINRAREVLFDARANAIKKQTEVHLNGGARRGDVCFQRISSQLKKLELEFCEATGISLEELRHMKPTLPQIHNLAFPEVRSSPLIKIGKVGFLGILGILSLMGVLWVTGFLAGVGSVAFHFAVSFFGGR